MSFSWMTISLELVVRMPASKFLMVPPKIVTLRRPVTLIPAPVPDPAIV
jgi:hypothetical protein